MDLEHTYHFIGIGGSGMSPLAHIILGLGCKVTGSDVRYSPHLAELEAEGAVVYSGHDPAVAIRADAVVVSAAVPAGDPELVAARAAGIPVFTRAQLLGQLFDAKRGIGVTGTHGKSTTTAMVSSILMHAGLDPVVAVGAGLSWAPSGGHAGRGDYMVVEADEAYGSFLTLRPEIAVVTNIDDDHRDYYGSFDRIMEAFTTYLEQVKPGGTAVLCADDPHVLTAAENVKCQKVFYGLNGPSGHAGLSGSVPGAWPYYTAVDRELRGLGSRFRVMHNGHGVGVIELNVPGEHNIANATAAFAVAHIMGIDPAHISAGLREYAGAERRCQVLMRAGGITVVDDYAHHPSEIRATLAALRSAAEGRLVVVFQPQRYTRTSLLFDDFVKSFGLADVIAVTEVYHEGTGESAIPGVSGRRLAQAIAEHEGKSVRYLADRFEALDYMRDEMRPGDTVVTMGAGDIYRSARSLAEELRDRVAEHTNGGGW
jgi:UDP-N-acetylmuramate--alanine ligase